MGLTVSVNHPHLEEDVLVSVGGLIAVQNGGSTEVGPETEQLFIDQNGVSIEHYLRTNEIVTVSGSAEVDWTPPEPDEEEEQTAGGYMMMTDTSDVVAKALEGGE